MKPICVHCQRFYRPERNGIYFTEMKPRINGAKAGTREPDNWTPYKVWMGDLWKCPDCHHLLICGVAGQPVAQDYQPRIKEALKFSRTVVNDC